MKYQGIYWGLLPIFSRCGLMMLLSVVLLADSVGAMPRSTGLQIAQQQGTQQEAMRTKAHSLYEEGEQLYQQGTAESLRKAIEKWQEALPLYRAVGNKEWEAITFLGIGRVYDALGEKQKALEYYNQALPLFRAVGDKGGEAATLNNIGLVVYDALGEKQKALEYYNQALPLFHAVGDKAGEATTFNNIGKVYDDLGEKQKALEYYNQALSLYRAVDDKGGEATTLNNIGLVYSNLGEKQKALEYYNQALSLYRAVYDKRREAITLNNIGGVYDDFGEKQKALEYYNQALLLSRVVGDKGGEATTFNNIGKVYDDLGEKQKALEYYNQALSLYRAVDDKGGEATTLNNIGLVYSNLGEKQKALEYYNQALLLSRVVDDKGEEATTLHNIGKVYSDLGEKQKALEYYNQALLLSRVVGDKGGEAITLNNIGKVYDDLGEKQKALEYFNQALPLSRAVGDRGGEAGILKNIAKLERSRGNLQKALTNIKAAIEIVEKLRTKIVSQELRTSYFATVQDYYKFYIDLLMQLHKQNSSKGYDALALNISERSRARVLVELLSEANIDIHKGVNPQLLAEEHRLQTLLDGKDKFLSALMSQKEAPTQVVETTKKQIEDLLQQQQEFKNKLRATNPEYAALKYPQPLTLPQIQQQLDPDTVLLQYSLGKDSSYLWLVTANSFTSYELPKEADIDKAARKLIEQLKAPTIAEESTENTAENVAEIGKNANELSQLILKPVADKLGQKRLVIDADGILHQIPFAVLSDLTEKVKYQPLLVNHEIINLPSVTSLATHRQELQNRKIAPKTLAVLADPVFSNDDTRVTGKPETSLSPELDLELSALRRSSANRGTLSRLPGTRQEADDILKFVPNNNSLEATDFDANFNLATNSQLSQFRIVHFATHGLIDMKNPELSGIVLSLVDKQGKAQKGFLRLNDIFNLDLPAELVVLSACESGLGEEVQGEGLVGLTRGLMYAGSAKVVVSLWKVNDEATANLMSEFYRQMLKEGKSPVVALRTAQLKLWEQQTTQDPRFWAAFTMQGEWRK